MGLTEQIFEKHLQQQTIFRDRNLITPHYTPEVLPFRERQLSEISELLAVSLNGKKPNNIFVYGKVGTGKTSVAKHVLRQLLDFAGKKNCRVKGTYINCRNENSKYKVLLKSLKDFYPEQSFLGFSSSFVFEKLMEYASGSNHLIFVLDEIDKVKDVDELVYSLTRANDDLSKGSISILGISNNLQFKDRLDPRTRSSLCEYEMVFPPYNAKELREILSQRALLAFKPATVQDSALSLAAAFAAQESGDARTAVMLLLRAGEIADKLHLSRVSDVEVRKAKNKVEEEIIFNMISTLPEQQQLVLYAIAFLSLNKPSIQKITGVHEAGVLFSGEIYDEYLRIAKGFSKSPITSRWYRQYINELETYGLIFTTDSGKGIRGQTRLVKLGFDAKKIACALEKGFRQA